VYKKKKSLQEREKKIEGTGEELVKPSEVDTNFFIPEHHIFQRYYDTLTFTMPRSSKKYVYYDSDEEGRIFSGNCEDNSDENENSEENIDTKRSPPKKH